MALKDSLTKLSPRERDVFFALGNGESVGHTADRLYRSKSTISAQRTRILEKLGLTTTSELIALALKIKANEANPVTGCRLCGVETDVVFNINFRMVRVCASCAGAITKQNVMALVDRVVKT